MPPKTHNLVFLLNKIALNVPEEHLKTIESLNHGGMRNNRELSPFNPERPIRLMPLWK
jgi:HEPN domain-containing protein